MLSSKARWVKCAHKKDTEGTIGASAKDDSFCATKSRLKAILFLKGSSPGVAGENRKCTLDQPREMN